MALKWRTAPEDILDSVELDRVNMTMALLRLETGVAIDSYSMSADGPTLSSIFVISDNYLVEVALLSKSLQFDVIAANRLFNYRVNFGTSEIRAAAVISPPVATPVEANQDPTIIAAEPGQIEQEPQPSSSIKYVEIELRHTEKSRSTLSYFGEDVNDWLSFVFDAYPKSLLLG